MIMALVQSMKQRKLSINRYQFQVGNEKSAYNTLGDWLCYLHICAPLQWLIQQTCMFMAVRGWMHYEDAYSSEANHKTADALTVHENTVIRTIALLLAHGASVNKSGTDSAILEGAIQPLEYGPLEGELVKYIYPQSLRNTYEGEEPLTYHLSTLCTYLIQQGAHICDESFTQLEPGLLSALKKAVRHQEQVYFDA